jgi:hypothetical protein
MVASITRVKHGIVISFHILLSFWVFHLCLGHTLETRYLKRCQLRTEQVNTAITTVGRCSEIAARFCYLPYIHSRIIASHSLFRRVHVDSDVAGRDIPQSTDYVCFNPCHEEYNVKVNIFLFVLPLITFSYILSSLTLVRNPNKLHFSPWSSSCVNTDRRCLRSVMV